MIGLIPALRAAWCNSTAPFITPWSVRPSAGCPNDAARSTSPSIFDAPSSSEYSEWTCRWAQVGSLMDRVRMLDGRVDKFASRRRGLAGRRRATASDLRNLGEARASGATAAAAAAGVRGYRGVPKERSQPLE